MMMIMMMMVMMMNVLRMMLKHSERAKRFNV